MLAQWVGLWEQMISSQHCSSSLLLLDFWHQELDSSLLLLGCCHQQHQHQEPAMPSMARCMATMRLAGVRSPPLRAIHCFHLEVLGHRPVLWERSCLVLDLWVSKLAVLQAFLGLQSSPVACSELAMQLLAVPEASA